MQLSIVVALDLTDFDEKANGYIYIYNNIIVISNNIF